MKRRDPIRANCRLDFFPAYHHSGSRSLSQIWWIVLHDEEAPTAAGAAEYFENKSSGGSAALCVDEEACYRTLADDAIAWGARSAPAIGANAHGFHVEQAGYARWLPKRWLLHKMTLERAAFKTARHLRKFGLEPVFVDAAAIVAGVRRGHPAKGVTTHAEITKASKILDPLHAWKYDHTDPGRFWPRRRFMKRVLAYYAELK